nr:hypothetical protein CFP56_68701 [Quercus suber]
MHAILNGHTCSMLIGKDSETPCVDPSKKASSSELDFRTQEASRVVDRLMRSAGLEDKRQYSSSADIDRPIVSTFPSRNQSAPCNSEVGRPGSGAIAGDSGLKQNLKMKLNATESISQYSYIL